MCLNMLCMQFYDEILYLSIREREKGERGGLEGGKDNYYL